MNREELKNRMDQLPNDFDQEGLWNKINPAQEDKKTNKWIFLLLGLIGVLACTVVLWNMEKSEGSLDTSFSKTQLELHKPEIIQSTYNDTKNKTISKANNNNNSPVPNSTSKINVLENKHPFTTKNINTSKLLKSSSSKDKIIANPLQNRRNNDIPILKASKHESYSSNNKAKLYANNPPSSLLNTDTKSNTTIISKLDRAIASQCKLLPKISSLIHKNYSPLTLNHIKISNDFKNNFQNSLSFSIGLGYDNHQFSDNVYGDIRNLFESGMETFSIGTNYSRRLNKSFFIEAGITMTRSQTKLVKTDKSSTLTYIREENPLSTWEASTYNYYNQYYRLDTEIGLGYIYHLSSSWTINPVIGVGYNIYSTQRGDILSTKLLFIDLHKVAGYKKNTGLYGTFSLKTEKNWKNQYVFGVQLGLQTKRKLLQTVKYAHSITPMKSTIYVSKLF